MGNLESIRRIDIHAHAVAFPEYVPPHIATGTRFLSAPELIEVYDKVGIEKGVLLPIVSPEAQCMPMTTEGCMALADAHPERFVWFCNVDPRMIDNTPTAKLSYLLSYYKSRGARGMGELTTPLPADDPMLRNLYACLEELDLPLTIHIAPATRGYYGIVDEPGLPRLERILREYPRLKILGHSQVFWSEISADNTVATRSGYPTGRVIPGRIVELMRMYSNLYCDLSANSGANAMMRDPAFAAGFMEEFSDRILFGCDICSPKNLHQYKFSDFLLGLCCDGILSEETYRRVVRENAVKLLNL